MDIHRDLADIVQAIKSDPELTKAFTSLLEMGSSSQQVYVERLLSGIAGQAPPDHVVRFISLLKDDKIAQLVYSELKK